MRWIRRFLCLAVVIAPVTLGGPHSLLAHEGHDHDKPPPLALPVAPRVVAVTPDLELVGVSSGKGRLTIFLHRFATNEPVKGARMTLSVGDKSVAAKSEDAGVFTVVAPWLEAGTAVDIVFALKLPDGTEDLLTGQLELSAPQSDTAPRPAQTWILATTLGRVDVLIGAAAGLVLGVLATLLLVGSRADGRSGIRDEPALAAARPTTAKGETASREMSRLTRTGSALVLLLIPGVLLLARPTHAGELAKPPTIPSTMATDQPQRMADGTIFLPKATQHLLSIRTMVSVRRKASLATELTGTVIPGPEHLGRVQPGRPGRIEAGPKGLAYVGKRVERGELLAFVHTYIEAADRANIESQIAETEARIKKNQIILSRYERSPGSVPQVKVDEIRGELEALKRKRAELLPSVARREPIQAPISGVVSVANATIGQIVEARDVLFEIVDPSQFWVEAVAFDPRLTQSIKTAFAVTGDGRRLDLAFAGRGLALRQQAAILSFRITGTPEALSIGSPVRVVLQSTAETEGFVLPASAIVRAQSGLPIVWVKTDAERFEPHAVKVRPLDGASVLITAGLKEDLRVVTDGATLLNQVR